MNGWFTLIAFGAGFLVAQLWKVFAGLLLEKDQLKDWNLKTLIGYFSRSGGMPSGHAASMTAATVYLGYWCGFDSAIFVLAVCMTGVVIYDAVHVRYAVGEHGKVLNETLRKEGKKELDVVEGHTVAQAAVGIILGVVIGCGMYLLTR